MMMMTIRAWLMKKNNADDEVEENDDDDGDDGDDDEEDEEERDDDDDGVLMMVDVCTDGVVMMVMGKMILCQRMLAATFWENKSPSRALSGIGCVCPDGVNCISVVIGVLGGTLAVCP